MKVVIAMDSFKGSLTSLEAGNAARNGVLLAFPQAEVIVKPLADGGEGTTDALIEGMQGERVELLVTGPFGNLVNSYYGIIQNNTAVMEMAQAAGLTKVTTRNPLVATTYGVGEMIRDAIRRGCRQFVIGIGGSATNDGGIGMLQALGFEFLDKKGDPVGEGAQALGNIATIQSNRILPELKECEFQIACDVQNPLCGESGATYVYGPQKGLSKDMCQSIDEGMRQYAEKAQEYVRNIKRNEKRFYDTEQKNVSYMDYPGAGAAGGLGFAFLTFLNGKLVSGVDLVLDTIGLEQELLQTDIVITGEGCLDHQSVMGKAPIGVATRAKKYGCKVLAFAGSIGDGADACLAHGIDEFYPIATESIPLEERMKKENALIHMEQAVKNVMSAFV